MTLAMAVVGDLVSPRERGRYQGYIAATFAVATIVGPLIGGLLVENASWRWVFYVNLPLGVAALAGLACGCRRRAGDRPSTRSTSLGAALLAGATSALMLACIWGGDRYAWDSAPILGADRRDAAALGVGLVARERRARRPDRAARTCCGRRRSRSPARRCSWRPRRCSRSPSSSRCSCRRRPGRRPTEAGLLLVPVMLGHHGLDHALGAQRSRAPAATSASRSPGWR